MSYFQWAVWWWVNEWVGQSFNTSITILYVISHISLSSQSLALVLTIKPEQWRLKICIFFHCRQKTAMYWEIWEYLTVNYSQHWIKWSNSLNSNNNNNSQLFSLLLRQNHSAELFNIYPQWAVATPLSTMKCFVSQNQTIQNHCSVCQLLFQCGCC